MIELMPRLSEQFHLTPMEVRSLTLEELGVYLDAARHADAEAERMGA